jgi:site-specific DNA-methyltransferase (cytosine-N4-specific)
MSILSQVPDEAMRNFFRVSISNVLRRLSFQREDDLRIRREQKIESDLDTYREFLEELGRSVRFVLAFLWQGRPAAKVRARVLCGDAREITDVLHSLRGRVDICITSPPYATALPYLDTDRLSLTYLGLLSRAAQRRLDGAMIGNREITSGVRKRLEDEFANSRHRLPGSTVALVEEVAERNRHADVGFRRRNLAALLGKYFLDMRRVTDGLYALMRRGGHVFMVVGRNHTIAGGQRVDINTDLLLADIAEQSRLRLEQLLPMEMLVSRDIFRANASNAETVLFLRKP